MRSLTALNNILILVTIINKSQGFIHTPTRTPFLKQTQLNAISVLARKAKEVFIQQWKDSDDVPSDVVEKLNDILEKKENYALEDGATELQQALTKRRGTITVVAEYKRKLDKGGFIDETLDPEILSPKFREFGATAIA